MVTTKMQPSDYIEKAVKGIIGRLEGTRHTSLSQMPLTNLRRDFGQTGHWRHLSETSRLLFMQDDIYCQQVLENRSALKAVHIALCVYAYQRHGGKPKPRQNLYKGCARSVGEALMRASGGDKDIDRWLGYLNQINAASQEGPMLSAFYRAIRILKSRHSEIELDWPRLAVDLYYWLLPSTRFKTIESWEADFFTRRMACGDDENSNTDEDSNTLESFEADPPEPEASACASVLPASDPDNLQWAFEGDIDWLEDELFLNENF